MKPIDAAINDLKHGKMIILTDHPDRENEGDLVFPAETVTTEMINFMIRNCSGIICLSLLEEQLKKIGVDYMVAPNNNTSSRGTPFTVSIEAQHGVSTGVSAHDRAVTIRTAISDNVKPEYIAKPGHIFPLYARAGGVLERQGHTEGSIDIARLAGFQPAAVLCEVMNPDGSMARGAQLENFAKQHQLTMISIDDIVDYRRANEDLIVDQVETHLPIANRGIFKLSVFKEKYSTSEHLALSNIDHISDSTLVRIHSACATGDIFGSQRCDCNIQLEYSLQKLSEKGGVLIYLDQEGRGIGLFNKIKAYSLQDKGYDTVAANQCLGLPVDDRNYSIAANILRNMGVTRIRLLTNNPAKIDSLKKYGIMDVQREEIPVFCNQFNKDYLQTKKNKLNHLIQF